MSFSPADPRLMQGFNFDEQDLMANRAGRITQRQMGWLKHERAQVKKQTWGCLGGLLAVSAFYILIGLINNGRIPTPSPRIGGDVGVNWFVAALVIVTVGIALLLYISDRRTSRDWTLGRAEVLEGRVEVSVVAANKDIYSVKINGKTFNISKSGYDALTALHEAEGAEAVYRVYYAPGSWKILSMEKRAGESA